PRTGSSPAHVVLSQRVLFDDFRDGTYRRPVEHIIYGARAVLFCSAPRVRMAARAIRELLQLVTRDDERPHDRRCAFGNERDVCVYGRQLGADARYEAHRRRRGRRAETALAT